MFNCTECKEPPYAERHVRWCERSENKGSRRENFENPLFSSYSIINQKSGLFRQEFRRGEACDFLEDPVEVVRVSEAQQMGRFADIVSVHQEAFPPFNHERMDVADGRTACSFMDHVAQIAGRIRQF